mmetsp:Transcript_29030/g.33440  ORF Transcript_29030/g.33440 Transcript_29030/m.33440 type:complete len:95 (-) Transcript_29030:86-370(-)
MYYSSKHYSKRKQIIILNIQRNYCTTVNVFSLRVFLVLRGETCFYAVPYWIPTVPKAKLKKSGLIVFVIKPTKSPIYIWPLEQTKRDKRCHFIF